MTWRQRQGEDYVPNTVFHTYYMISKAVRQINTIDIHCLIWNDCIMSLFVDRELSSIHKIKTLEDVILPNIGPPPRGKQSSWLEL